MARISALRSYLNALPAGYQLHWYTIEQVIGQGAFGITYIATDVNLSRKVAIKEYMPAQLAIRADNDSAQPISLDVAEKYFWGKDRFLNEAQLLADVEHPNIVRVFSVFETNNTAYMVMQFERGESLDNILKRHGTLDENQVLEILYPMMDGLEFIHSRKIIHRDIKPGNIYIREEGPPVLLDFGSARRSLQSRTARLTSLVTPGYAPIEQYGARADKQGPWTDIYGLGATLYRTISGEPPPDAINRSEGIATESRDTYRPDAVAESHRFSPAILSAIDQALQFKPQDRPQSIDRWRENFENRFVEPHARNGNLFSVTSLTMNHFDNPPEVLPSSHEESSTEIAQSHTSRTNTYTNHYHQALTTSRVLIAAMVILAVSVIIYTRPQPDLSEVSFSDVSANEVPELGADPIDAYVESLLPTVDHVTATESDPLDDISPALAEINNSFGGLDITSATTIGSETVSIYANTSLETTPSPEFALSELSAILSAAKLDVAAQRLTRPAGANALEKYRAALVLAPGNAEAKAGLDAIVDAYAQLITELISKNRFDEAAVLIDRAVGISSGHQAIDEAKNKLELARFEYAINQVASPSPEERPERNLASIEPKLPESKKRAEDFLRRMGGE